MAASYKEYLASVRSSLSTVLCLHNLPGIQPEHPEVEFPTSPELSLQPLTIHRSPTESCYIEPTINSARISLKIKQTDDLERWLTKKWITLLTQAAYAEVYSAAHRLWSAALVPLNHSAGCVSAHFDCVTGFCSGPISHSKCLP